MQFLRYLPNSVPNKHGHLSPVLFEWLPLMPPMPLVWKPRQIICWYTVRPLFKLSGQLQGISNFFVPRSCSLLADFLLARHAISPGEERWWWAKRKHLSYPYLWPNRQWRAARFKAAYLNLWHLSASISSESEAILIADSPCHCCRSK